MRRLAHWKLGPVYLSGSGDVVLETISTLLNDYLKSEIHMSL